MDVSDSYKVLVSLTSTVKNEEDKVHLKKEVKKQLLPAFTSREESRIAEALQCYKDVCQKLRSQNFEWDVLDDLDDLLLSIMENEQNLALRKCYEDVLLVVVSDSGLASLKWSNRLIDLFKDYCRLDIGSGCGLTSLRLYHPNQPKTLRKITRVFGGKYRVQPTKFEEMESRIFSTIAQLIKMVPE